MKSPGFKFVVKGKSQGIVCGRCQKTSYNIKHVVNRYCPYCKLYLETPTQRSWRQFKEKPEYQASAFPFPPRRMSTFEKLHSVLIGGLMFFGFLYWAFEFIVWFFE